MTYLPFFPLSIIIYAQDRLFDDSIREDVEPSTISRPCLTEADHVAIIAINEFVQNLYTFSNQYNAGFRYHLLHDSCLVSESAQRIIADVCR